jgi:hypothetical protein
MVDTGAEEQIMKQTTLLLFQLFLAVYAFYAVMSYTAHLRLVVPLLCLVGMFVVSKIEAGVTKRAEEKKAEEEAAADGGEEKAAFKPLDCLLNSKNVLLLTDAIHHLLNDLGLAVSRSPNLPAIDRLLTVPGKQVTFGLKILGDVAELQANWEKWDEVIDFELGKGGKRRLLVIGSNSTNASGEDKQTYKNFSASAQSLLAGKHVVGMTTLTFYKIYMLCKKKNLDPKKILNLIHQHPGGVFQLEQYAKPPGHAA